MAKGLGINKVKFVERPFGALVAGSPCDCDIDFSQVTTSEPADPRTQAFLKRIIEAGRL
jgi:hypothetical protein